MHNRQNSECGVITLIVTLGKDDSNNHLFQATKSSNEHTSTHKRPPIKASIANRFFNVCYVENSCCDISNVPYLLCSYSAFLPQGNIVRLGKSKAEKVARLQMPYTLTQVTYFVSCLYFSNATLGSPAHTEDSLDQNPVAHVYYYLKGQCVTF